MLVNIISNLRFNASFTFKIFVSEKIKWKQFHTFLFEDQIHSLTIRTNISVFYIYLYHNSFTKIKMKQIETNYWLKR